MQRHKLMKYRYPHCLCTWKSGSLLKNKLYMEHNFQNKWQSIEQNTANFENDLLEWFCHARVNNILVEGPMVKEKTNEIALKMEIKFQCPNGWLQHFKQWQNITWQAIRGQSSVAHGEASGKWHESVVPITEHYVPKDIF
jgi:hypothetical protein